MCGAIIHFLIFITLPLLNNALCHPSDVSDSIRVSIIFVAGPAKEITDAFGHCANRVQIMYTVTESLIPPGSHFYFNF